MTFNPVTTCGSDGYADAVMFVAIWFLPTVLFALRSCKPTQDRANRLTVWAYGSGVFAVAITGVWQVDLPEWVVLTLVVAVISLPTALAAVGLYRLAFKR